jgi:putative peptidoglycan lipid II flippase
MIKGFRQIASLTTISRVLGMLRDMAFAYFLGAGGMMDSWVIAFKIPNLARRLFGEGAASASFIPVYNQELHRDKDTAYKLACTVVTVVFLILLSIVLLGLLGILIYYKFYSVHQSNRQMLELTSIMMPYMILICVIAILAGVLNSHGHFAAPAAAPIVLNIFIIGSLCISGWVLAVRPSQQVYIIAVAVLLAGFVQLAMQMVPLYKRGIVIKPAWQVHSDSFKKIIFLMGPMILGLTVTQINTLADDIIARCLSGSLEKGEFFIWLGTQVRYPVWDGAVSQLYYSQRLYQFPLGVLGISLATAIFPVMSAAAARKDFSTLNETISKGVKGAIFVAVPATAGLILVARPLVSVIFEHGEFSSDSTLLVSRVLCFYAIGLTGYFSQQVLTRAYYSIQDSKLPAITAIVAVVINIILNLILIWFMGTAGLALSTAVCSYAQVIILLMVLKKRFGRSILDGLFTVVVKSVLAACIMSVVAMIILRLLETLPFTISFDIIRLIIVVPLSALAYFFASKFLRNDMTGLVTGKTNGRHDIA